MDHDVSKPGEESDAPDLVCLLRTLRVESTPEAQFEERFIYNFRERVEREAVCRSARSIFWEHLRMFLENVGIRHIALGASTFGMGALCVGVLVWRFSAPVQHEVNTALCELEARANSLQPGISRHVTCMAVGPRSSRNSENKVVILTDEEDDPFYTSNRFGESPPIRQNFSSDSLPTPFSADEIRDFFRRR